jgi:hypothetical protein
MSKMNYVCATCGQDFTRRCSANRHNNHFHFGNGIIVRFLEYIIGRINGQFLPPPNNNMIYQLKLLENGGITSTTAAHLLVIIMVFVVAMVDLQLFQTRKGIYLAVEPWDNQSRVIIMCLKISQK